MRAVVSKRCRRRRTETRITSPIAPTMEGQRARAATIQRRSVSWRRGARRRVVQNQDAVDFLRRGMAAVAFVAVTNRDDGAAEWLRPRVSMTRLDPRCSGG